MSDIRYDNRGGGKPSGTPESLAKMTRALPPIEGMEPGSEKAGESTEPTVYEPSGGNRIKYAPGEGKPYGNLSTLEKFLRPVKELLTRVNPGARTVEEPQTGGSLAEKLDAAHTVRMGQTDATTPPSSDESTEGK